MSMASPRNLQSRDERLRLCSSAHQSRNFMLAIKDCYVIIWEIYYVLCMQGFYPAGYFCFLSIDMGSTRGVFGFSVTRDALVIPSPLQDQNIFDNK